jgi:hypothetical protein
MKLGGVWGAVGCGGLMWGACHEGIGMQLGVVLGVGLGCGAAESGGMAHLRLFLDRLGASSGVWGGMGLNGWGDLEGASVDVGVGGWS